MYFTVVVAFFVNGEKYGHNEWRSKGEIVVMSFQTDDGRGREWERKRKQILFFELSFVLIRYLRCFHNFFDLILKLIHHLPCSFFVFFLFLFLSVPHFGKVRLCCLLWHRSFCLLYKICWAVSIKHYNRPFSCVSTGRGNKSLWSPTNLQSCSIYIQTWNPAGFCQKGAQFEFIRFLNSEKTRGNSHIRGICMQKSILMSTCLQNNILSVTVGTALHLVRLFSSLQLYKQKSQNLVSPKFMRFFLYFFKYPNQTTG